MEYEGNSLLDSLMEKDKWTNVVYSKLISVNVGLNNIIAVSNKTLGIEIEIDQARAIAILINKTIDIPKYRSFQYRLIHNAILLNDRLKHYNIVESNKCTNCGEEKETIRHFFYECVKMKRLLIKLQKYLSDVTQTNIIFNDMMEIVTGVRSDGNCRELFCINLALIVLKQKVYAAKCQNKTLMFNKIVKECNFIRKTQRKKALQSKVVKRYNATWPDSINFENQNNSNDMELFSIEYINKMSSTSTIEV